MACERAAMLEVVAKLKNIRRAAVRDKTPLKDVVIDTGGSVIYTGDDILQTLKNMTHIVHLASSPEAQKIWGKDGEIHNRQADETNEQALIRCYPALLESREKQYKALASGPNGNTAPYAEHRGPHATIQSMFGVTPAMRSRWPGRNTKQVRHGLG
jgi:shikimate kinase